MMTVQFMNPEETTGRITLDGVDHWGPIPPNDGPLRSVYDAWIAEGNILEPYSPPSPTPVLFVTSAQAKVALYRKGYLTQVKDAIATYPEDVQLWYDNARNWERYNPYVMGLGLELGLSDEEIDELFTYADTLSQ